MDIEAQIEQYIAGQSVSKRIDMQALHQVILQLMPGCK